MSSAPLLSAQELTKTFGSDILFSRITIAIEENEKIALIGPNGSGKSTLLRMFAGIEPPDQGMVRPRRGLLSCYVAQEDTFPDSATVSEVLSQVLIAAGEDEHEIEGKVGIALGRAGFNDADTKVSTLSGGWKKRLSIIRGLIREPELLLLDEPTNHLDIEGVLWLEELLEEASFAVVFISHDRYFIERLAARVIEINRRFPEGFLSVRGDYADFLEERTNFLSNLHQAQESLANRVRREVAWLRQGAKARTTKSKHRIAAAHNLVEELGAFNLEEKNARLEFGASQRKSRELIKVEGVRKSYGDRTLFKDVTLTISPGVRLGIVGSNGSGKTTFVRTLLGDLKPDAGSVVHATNLKFAFFDQARRQLDRTVTLKKALCPDGDGVVFNGKPLHVTSWAKRFLFSPDQLSTPVSKLSGGEQARVLLAKIMIQPVDILLFDEPTNDLDIPTLEVLEESFYEFPGAIVLVTHDRYLLDRVATTVLGIAPSGTSLYGSYSQWEEAQREREQAALARDKKPTQKTNLQKPVQEAKAKMTYKDHQELSKIEEKILRAEDKAKAIQERLFAPENAQNPAALTTVSKELGEAQKVVETLYARWEELEAMRKSDAEG